MKRFAECHSTGEECRIEEFIDRPEEPATTPEAMRDLEIKHNVILLYMWLGYLLNI